MKSNKKFGHKGGTAFCRGYIDEHGQWNNGFHCPKWGPPDTEYCCGPATHRQCCEPQATHDDDAFHLKHAGIIVSVLLGCIFLIIIVMIIVCYAYKWLCFSKRRKISRTCNHNMQHADHRYYARDFTRCNNHSNYAAPSIPMTHVNGYNLCESPPPYPGRINVEEKVPLNQEHFVNADLGDSPQRLNVSPTLPCVNQSQSSFTTTTLFSPNQLQTVCPDLLYRNHVTGSDLCNGAPKGHVIRNPNAMQSEPVRNTTSTMNGYIPKRLRNSQTSPLPGHVTSLPQTNHKPNPVAVRPHTLFTRDMGYRSRDTSHDRGSEKSHDSPPMTLSPFQETTTMSDADALQNCNNEQRQIYNMVIVGVQPDLPDNTSPHR